MYKITFFHPKHGTRKERYYTVRQRYLMEKANWWPAYITLI